MFKKALIAEDFDTNNQQLVKLLLEDIKIEHVESTMYCDDALLKFKKASKQDNAPFELLITDLSFKEDHRERNLTSGLELIEAVRQVNPLVKVIIFSIEDRPSKIKQIISSHAIDSFIPKGRNALKELKKAVTQTSQGKPYFPHNLNLHLKKENLLILENYDKEILKRIATGHTKDDVSEVLKKKAITPSSVSSIEKRLQKLYLSFNAKNTTHLIAIVQKEGLI